MMKMIPVNKIKAEWGFKGFGKSLSWVGYNSGATSVLVVFMMMVLVSLGAFAITSANVNYKLSLRASQWNAMYYSLDASAEEYLSQLDARLFEAEEKAIDYIIALSAAIDENHGRLPDDFDMESYGISIDIHTEVIRLQAENLGNAIKTAYMYYVALGLDQLDINYPGMTLSTEGDDLVPDAIRTQVEIKHDMPDYENCFISVTVLVKSTEYQIDQSDRHMQIARVGDNPLYLIEEWSEYQEDETVNTNGAGIWNGIF